MPSRYRLPTVRLLLCVTFYLVKAVVFKVPAYARLTCLPTRRGLSCVHSSVMAKATLPNPPPPPITTSTLKLPSPHRGRPKKLAMPRDTSIPGKLKLPNERDESVSMTSKVPDLLIKQAALDVTHGLQDTSKGVELNTAYKKLK